MVKQRTLELENAHQKILVLEKETTEKQLAGGFAHEMRNALVGPKLIIQNALGEDGDVPFQSVSIENSRKLKEIYFLIKDDISENKLKQALNLMSSIYQNEEQMDKNLKMIYRSIAKGLSITQTIMDYAAMGNEVTNRSSIDLILFLKNIIREQEEEFNKLDIKIQLNTSESSFLFLGHESHFDSLFKNIILNAKDALLEKKALGSVDLKIDIDVRLLDSNFILQIKDNGIGILSENLNKIYDAFFSTKPGTGTGLGLGVVKKIINMYNGKINVKSEFQKGTVFEITLPVL